MISPFVETILIFSCINAILALSLYLPVSCGQLSLAQGGFMAIGAYTSAVLTRNFGVPFSLALIAGAVASSIIGIGIGVPALRIKGIYLLLMTLGFNEIIRVFFLNFDYTGAVGGFGGITQFTNLANVFIVLLLLIIFVYRIEQSQIGRAFRAISIDQDAAEARGIPLTRMKTFAFGAGALIAGLSGGLYAHFIFFIQSENFGFSISLNAMLFVLLGGSRSFVGALVGAFLITVLPELFRFVQLFRSELFGASLVIMMIVRPEGLVDEKICQLKWWKEKILCLRSK